MNKSFKVVFNKARGALMVVNEVTSCVQAKGTKTVIAAAVAALVAGGAVAADTQWKDAPEGLESVTDATWDTVKPENKFVWAPEGEQTAAGTFLSTNGKETFEGKLWVSGDSKAAQATGLAVSGADGNLTNAGTIYVTSGKNGVSYQNKGIWAGNGATATNAGVIVAKNAYGMTVGTEESGANASKIVNKGTIYVEETGVGMELGGVAKSEAENHGTIVVGTPTTGEDVDGGSLRFGHGVLIKDTSNNTFTNYGTIEAAKDATAIEIQVSNGKTTASNTINLEKGSSVNGLIHNHANVSGTTLKANGFVGTIDLQNDSTSGMTIEVNQDANLTLADGHGSKALTAVINDGVLSASIWQKYTVGEGEGAKEASDNQFTNVTVNEGGIFNVKQYNSVWDDPTTKDVNESAVDGAEKNQLLIKGEKETSSNWTLAGGALQVAGQDFTGHLKVGTSSDKGSFTIESGDYSYNSLTLGKAGTTTVNGGSLTVGHLTLSDGNTNNSALVYVGENGSLTVNGTLSATGTYASHTVGTGSVQGVYVAGDLTLGSDAKLDLANNALTIDGELNAAQGQIFKATTTEDGKTTTYALAEGADKIAFTEGAGLLLSDNVSMTQKDFTAFLGKLEGTWGEGVTAPEIVFTNVAFQGDVTFDTKLGYNTYATEVGAGTDAFNKETETTTISVTDDVAVGALKVDAGTKIVDLNHSADKEFVFAGLGGNVITGVDSVSKITSDGEVTLGWDENSKGVVNAETLEAKELFVSGQFEATNAVVTSGEIDRFGSLTLAKLSQANGATEQDVFTIHQDAKLDVQRLEIETNLEQGATLVIGDRLDAPATAEGIATLAVDDDKKLAQIADTVRVGGGAKDAPIVDAIGTTNPNGRNLLTAFAGDEYDATKNVGLYVDNTIAVDRDATDAKLFVGSIDENGKPNGSISLGSNAVVVIDVDAFSADKAVFDAEQLIVNADSKVLLKGADRIGSVKLVENGTTTEDNTGLRLQTVLAKNDTNAWLNYEVEQVQVEQGEGQTATTDVNLNVVFDKEATKDENLNVFAEKVLTTGSESIGVVNAIGTAYFDETTKKLSAVGEEALDEYMALPAVAGTYNAAYDAAEQVWNTVAAHNIDRTAGKTNGVWADVFYSANEAGDMYGNGYGYEADVYGGVLGYDYTAACGGKIGAALTIGTSDVDAKGDFVGDYGNDADFWGLSIYASKDITEKMIVSADITYLSLDNDIKGSVAGASVAESIDSSVISVGLRADWKAYESSAFEIVPHAGIRYAQIDVDDYREMDGESLDVLEMPVGVAFNGKFEAAGMKFVPTLDFTVVPQIGDTEVHPLNGDTLNVLNNTYNTTLGISAEYGDFTFGVAAKYGFGTDDRSNAGVKINATYAF